MSFICLFSEGIESIAIAQILSKNNKNFDQNVLRCAYSKLCNVPWSDLNCDKYNN